MVRDLMVGMPLIPPDTWRVLIRNGTFVNTAGTLTPRTSASRVGATAEIAGNNRHFTRLILVNDTILIDRYLKSSDYVINIGYKKFCRSYRPFQELDVNI